MSSTQEKQEHKCHWRAYCQPDGTVVCDECNTAADVNKLIDSAKREELERLHETLLMNEDNPDPVKLIEHRIAQLEQSEESI